MSDVNRKIFAELAGLSSGNLSNYIKRGKIIPNDDGTIDTEFELNKIFLENILFNCEKELISKILYFN